MDALPVVIPPPDTTPAPYLPQEETAHHGRRRPREGRLFVSPFLCNTRWGLHSIEGAIRSLYSARRLERAWGVPFDVAEHIELLSLPWGMATILAGCGVRWLSVPFLDYGCTFSELESPPILRHEGPDGGPASATRCAPTRATTIRRRRWPGAASR